MSLHKVLTIHAVTDPVTKSGEIRSEFKWLAIFKAKHETKISRSYFVSVYYIYILLGDAYDDATYLGSFFAGFQNS